MDEGWWEGKKADGTVGLFPQAYVEVSLSEMIVCFALYHIIYFFGVNPVNFEF